MTRDVAVRPFTHSVFADHESTWAVPPSCLPISRTELSGEVGEEEG